MNKSPALEIRHLTITVPRQTGFEQILKGVSFQIHPCEKFALLGKSGCGKSITALSIAGLQDPSFQLGGEIYFQGRSINQADQKFLRSFRGKQCGFIFQDPMSSLNPTLKVGDQIAEKLVYHEHCSWKNAKDRAIELMRKVKIPEPERRYNAFPFQLSGGQRQRIIIAMAIACNPALLIADEPTTALDPTIQLQILDLIAQLCNEDGMSLLLITHNLEIVARYCDTVAVMDQGKIVEIDHVKNIFKSSQHPFTRELLAKRI